MNTRRLEALLYDWECDHVLDRQTHDAGFFDQLLSRRLPRGGRVTVLGCGTGRVAIPLARAGWQVTALDISVERLALARSKASGPGAPDWRKGDMRAVPPDPLHDALIVPYSAFLLLHTDADRLACLKSMCHALAPGGIAVIDVSPNFPDKQNCVRRFELGARSPTIGGWVDYYETVRQRPDTGSTLIRRRYLVRLDKGEILQLTYAERWRHLDPADARALARAAGLGIVEAFSNYWGEPLFANGTPVPSAAKHIYVMAPLADPEIPQDG